MQRKICKTNAIKTASLTVKIYMYIINRKHLAKYSNQKKLKAVNEKTQKSRGG